MSYIRFGSDGSDVYVYLDVGGYLRCQHTRLRPSKLGGEDGIATTTAEMVTHLKAHLAAGDCVPDGVIEDLESRAKENDRWMSLTPAQRAEEL